MAAQVGHNHAVPRFALAYPEAGTHRGTAWAAHSGHAAPTWDQRELLGTTRDPVAHGGSTWALSIVLPQYLMLSSLS